MTIVNGRQIRDEIKETLKGGFLNVGRPVVLGIIYAGENPVIDSFVRLKQKFGEDMGVSVVVHRFPSDIRGGDLIEQIKNIQKESDGVVVQLPLPAHLDQVNVLSVLDENKDIDLLKDSTFKKFLNNETKMMPPVVGAIDEIFRRYSIVLKNNRIVIVGKGKLVGKPVFVWLMKEGVLPTVVGKEDNLIESLKDADIIISGVGEPNLITPDVVKDGVVLIDVGTSESGGTMVGDISRECESKASVFSAVPGGVGPITIAKLFENLFIDKN
ncbi:hypothetical protein COW81_03190 [Candidatus Campbellbacteria bacterium CG22_combo_CG10-13_8_21_14_all_36_13]|uniref:Uncharacterized protein n=1 Tax=Candidatus Campbellbacteria bacterium CG22_combo_CG10-13_8_21_14_all_36_13 TaxID=1974529 RepID=A0A2H0DYD5_9BACT|nr:MAG: hypothetical protein COW81_03190 [Candidatus Campbellbacteria bacterium CG22_combo_CG10-13_8_21_14_all_36_13]